jgi:transposase-like protein
VAAVALARGINAALLRRWVKEAERSGRPIAIRATAPSMALEDADSFVPVALPSNPAEGLIRIELRRKGRSMSMQWPASAARECALLLQELMK